MNQNKEPFTPGEFSSNSLNIVICGSINQSDQMVNLVNILDRFYQIEFGIDLSISSPYRAQEKLSRTNLARAHFKKIVEADVVLALSKPDGTFGESTANEMAFALENGVPVIPIKMNWVQPTGEWKSYSVFAKPCSFIPNPREKNLPYNEE